MITVLSGSVASASAAEESQAFEDAIKQECSILFDREFSRYRLHIDPYGAKSYGIAFAKGKLRSSSGLRAPDSSMICIYDKRSGRAEISQSFNSERLNYSLTATRPVSEVSLGLRVTK
nr:hypothetical protein [Photobacterium sp. OFAV2-7]